MFQLIFNSLLLGVGLAMDAFSVSIANGIIETGMKKTRMLVIAGIYAVFQMLMPLAGWFFVSVASERFATFHKLIPWIALILLVFIGGKMIFEAYHDRKKESARMQVKDTSKLTFGTLMLQGLATSIDALSVGFTIADYTFLRAFASSFIIGAVTLVICLTGLIFGRKIGTGLSGMATVAGGLILILIGIEIFVKGILGL